ncbi:WD40 repeat domain-containing protein [Streptomyces sp. UG1]|uniref:WD40 repeat domain-containing protein n=1 Tax=Streptomyces sp. UG1 TaxID=3417652 RepID=UPI003CF0FF17
MLRADSRLGRLVLALAAMPQAPAEHSGRARSRLVTALAAQQLPAREVPTMGESRIPRARRAGWLPPFVVACVVVVTSMAALTVLGVLPTPWQVTPRDTDPPRPERWRLAGDGGGEPGGYADALAFSPQDGRTLVLASGQRVQAWHLTDPEHPERVDLPARSFDGVSALAVTPDGETLVTAASTEVHGLSMDTGVLRWSVAGLHDDIKAVQAGERTVRLAVSDADNSTSVREISLPGGRTAAIGRRLSPAAHAAQFSPTGDLLALAGADGQVHLWDVSDPEAPRRDARFRTNGGEATGLAFSPDARLLATVGHDGIVRLWDVSDTSKPRYLGRPMADRTERARALAFSSDARLLAVVNAAGMAQVWWR